jgi:hypothetical protein
MITSASRESEHPIKTAPDSGDRKSLMRLVLTHAGRRNDEWECARIARQLSTIGILVAYDAVQMGPGKGLWDHISARFSSQEINAWAYLLTPPCLADRNCTNELLSALDRVCSMKGAGFPLVGLLHGISAQSLPPALKLRPFVHLADPGWTEQVKSILTRRLAESRTQFLWKIHECYGGDTSKTAIEVCPREEGIHHWRFAVPASSLPRQWGRGASGGGSLSPFRFSVSKGAGKLENTDITWFGSEDFLPPTESAYVVFNGTLPDFICFGSAKTPAGPPGEMEIYRLGLSRR